MTDLICFSHLRWNFVYQRPQHLLSRFSKLYRVFYWEEPEFGSRANRYEVTKVTDSDIWVVVPHLTDGLNEEEVVGAQRLMLNDLISSYTIDDYIAWYYSPMALRFSSHLSPVMVVYDCMDELSAFKFAPPMLRMQERELLNRADIVFTGGHNLFLAKKNQHHNIHCFPSSIDKNHFFASRSKTADKPDQQSIPHPRIGFYGVIDERINIDLIRDLAQKKPEWHFILIGPVVKIDPASLPVAPNIHWLGAKSYNELPDYLSGWDIAFMPFALNESTQYISPTKTPEYLAGGKPVISTSIVDVVHPYGENGLVHIADTAEEFIAAGEYVLKNKDDPKWLGKVDNYLSGISWDKTWNAMNMLLDNSMISVSI